MSKFKDTQEVIIKQVAGYKPREPIAVNNRNRFIPHGSHVTQTVTSSSAGLTQPIVEEMLTRLTAFVTVEGGDIRYRLDGVAATSTVGHLVKAGGSFALDSIEEIKAFRAIRNGTTDAILQVSFKKNIFE